MIQNFWLANGYNGGAIPSEAGELVGRRMRLFPAVSVPLMLVSTIVVAINTQLLLHTPLSGNCITRPIMVSK